MSSPSRAGDERRPTYTGQVREDRGRNENRAHEDGGRNESRAREDGGRNDSRARGDGGRNESRAREDGGRNDSRAREDGGRNESRAREDGRRNDSRARDDGGRNDSRARDDGSRNESPARVPGLGDKDAEIQTLQARIVEKDKELVLKRKEITGQGIEINTLRKKKEKDGLVAANASLVRKNKKLASDKDELRAEAEVLKKSCVNKDKEIDSLQRTTKRMRNKYEDIKEELTKKETEHLATLQRLKNEIIRLEKRFKTLNIHEVDLGETTGKDNQDSSSRRDANSDCTSVENKPNPESVHNISTSDSELPTKPEGSSAGSDSSSKKRKSADETLKSRKKKKTESNPPESNEHELLDDSFNNLIPVSDAIIGRNKVKNFESKTSIIPPPTDVVKYCNKNAVVTTLNSRISFLAMGETARQKHDVGKFGMKACGLSPVCSNINRGGEDIGYVYVCPPTNSFHKYYEKKCWVCWYHTQASLDGHHVQTQRVHVPTDTPKNQKPKEPLPNAPIKPVLEPSTHHDAEPGDKPVKLNLKARLNAASSDEDVYDSTAEVDDSAAEVDESDAEVNTGDEEM